LVKNCIQEKIDVNGRKFNISKLSTINGCFLIISEGDELRIGAISIAVKMGERSVATNIIPSKIKDVLPNLIAEAVSKWVNGVALVSTYIRSEVDGEIVKKLLTAVKSLL